TPELLKDRGQAVAADGKTHGSTRRPRRCAASVVELRHFREVSRGLAGVRIFGIDPGSARTGYGCVHTDGTRHRLVACGAIKIPIAHPFPNKLQAIHAELAALLAL